MSQFHNIFCKSGGPLTRSQIADRAREVWYDEGEPLFGPVMDDSPTWDRLEMAIPGVPRPVVFTNDTDPQVVSSYAAEVIQEAATPLAPPVVALLQQSRRVIGIELAPDLLTEDAWEVLDAMQSYIATALDGILVTNDGVYDAQLRPLDRL